LGYHFSTLVVLAGTMSFLVAAIVEDWRSGVTALLFPSACVPAYAFASRSRRTRMPELTSDPA